MWIMAGGELEIREKEREGVISLSTGEARNILSPSSLSSAGNADGRNCMPGWRGIWPINEPGGES